MKQGPWLSAEERRELKRLARREEGWVSDRLHMVLLADRGFSIAHIAAINESGEATVRQWLGRFETGGVAGLCDRPGSERPRPPCAAARRLICRTVERPHAAAGYGFRSWSVVMLWALLAARLRRALHRATVRRGLLALEYRWRRPKDVLPEDLAARAKLWALDEGIVRAPDGDAVLCAGDVDAQGPARPYPDPGHQPHGGGVRRAGAVDRALDVRAVPEEARDRVSPLPGSPAADLSGPADPIDPGQHQHPPRPVTLWLAHHPRLELLFLPTYSGHRHNPVEKVRWRLKDRVAANLLHDDLQALVAAVHSFFEEELPAEAALLVGG